MSMPYKNVLFPVDFSERSHAIVPHVREVCSRFNASLTLLHLVEMPVLAYGGVDAPVVFDFPMTEIKQSAEQKLVRFAATEFPGMIVKTFVAEGDPGSCIAELAKSWGIDLIMLPTRGRGRFRAALLGSVAATTLHDASCAVWTEAHCEEGGAAGTEWRNIVCAVDTVPEGSRLLRAAKELSSASGAKVHLVHAVPVAEAGTQEYFDREFAGFLKDRARQTIADMQKEAGTSFDVCIETGNIPETVRKAAVGHNADVVLIGRGAMPHFAGRLRSHAYAIVRDMPCPVLSV
jgi:nucleotide-binding universal stress UspA family protein